MAMNRRTRRHLQRQAAPASPTTERAGPAQFVGEVRSELKKVIWPTRAEIVNYSVVVFITIVILTAMIAGFDWILGEGVLRLFDVN